MSELFENKHNLHRKLYEAREDQDNKNVKEMVRKIDEVNDELRIKLGKELDRTRENENLTLFEKCVIFFLLPHRFGFDSHRVVAIGESWISKTCSKCNSKNATRTGQGQFNCHDCIYELDADLNGVKNIRKRLIQYALQPKHGYTWIRDTLTVIITR